MKRIINFSRGFLPAAIISSLLVVSGVVGFFINGGFNLGVDFQAGLMQEVQFAPRAFSLTYEGRGIAQVSLASNRLDIVVSGSDIDKATHSFFFDEYPTIGQLASAMRGLDGLSVADVSRSDENSAWLIQSAQQTPRLGTEPTALFVLAPNAEPLAIEEVRAALASLAGSAVQNLGSPSERKFMIRVIDDGSIAGFAKKAGEDISSALDARFGKDSWSVSQSNYVGSRFSKTLTDQVFILVALTLLLILVYASFRFKPKYAFGAVLAIIHDVLIMIVFIAFVRMEFSTLTIAALLTILGYSINDTIVIFDRIRENMRLYPEDGYTANMNRAISETLGRTIITTVTTLLAVLSLYIFTSGSMKDFALILIIGMLSGVYSTIYIASAFVHLWEKISEKRSAKKALAATAK